MNKITKLIIIAVAICSLSTQALAHGGEGRGGRGYGGGHEGYGLGLGIITGLAVGALAGSYAYQSYQPYPVYQQPYYPPQVYVAPPVQQCTNVVNQVVMNGYLQNVYSVACLQPNGQWMIVR